jgi:hypothetical protein
MRFNNSLSFMLFSMHPSAYSIGNPTLVRQSFQAFSLMVCCEFGIRLSEVTALKEMSQTQRIRYQIFMSVDVLYLESDQ